MFEFNYSKSAIMSYDYCPYSFYKGTILRERGKKWAPAVQGTELHLVYEKFFYPADRGGIDMKVLWKLDPITNFGKKTNQVYVYFYDVLFNSIDVSYRTSGKMLLNMRSFAAYQATRWRMYRYKYHQKSIVERYFLPLGLESKIVTNHPDVPRPLKGFIDIVVRHPKEPGKRETIIISDYKTGRIPLSLKRELDNEPNSVYSKDLPPKFNFEGNWYCLLYLLDQGYEFKLNPKHKGRNGPLYDLYYKGDVVKNVDWLNFAFIFTNSTKVYVGRKKAKINSMRAAMRKIAKMENELREIFRGEKEWLRKDDPYKCPNCSWFLTDCINVLDNGEVYNELILPDF